MVHAWPGVSEKDRILEAKPPLLDYICNVLMDFVM